MENPTDAEQGWLDDYSDSSFDENEFDSELDEDYAEEVSEEWYDYDDEYYEEDEDWYEYLFLLWFGDWDTDDEYDEIEVEEDSL